MTSETTRADAVEAATCDCTTYNGGQCYNCLNGAHRICSDGQGKCSKGKPTTPRDEAWCRELVDLTIERYESWLRDDEHDKRTLAQFKNCVTAELAAARVGQGDDGDSSELVNAENVLALIPEGETKGWTTTGKAVGKFGYVLWTRRNPGGIVLPGPEFTIGLNSFPFVNGITIGELRQLLAALGIPRNDPNPR